MQKLKLTLILPDKYPFVYEEKDWNVDLSSLESFVPLHQVEITLIQRCRFSTSKWIKPDQGTEEFLLAREAAMPLLKRELRGFAEALVSGKGGMRSREWYEGSDWFTLGKDGRPDSWLMKWCLHARRVN